MEDSLVSTEPPPFEVEEFRLRLERVQSAMTEAALDAILVTAEANFRYFTGFGN